MRHNHQIGGPAQTQSVENGVEAPPQPVPRHGTADGTRDHEADTRPVLVAAGGMRDDEQMPGVYPASPRAHALKITSAA